MTRKYIKIEYTTTYQLFKAKQNLIEDCTNSGYDAQQHVYPSLYSGDCLENNNTILKTLDKSIAFYFLENYWRGTMDRNGNFWLRRHWNSKNTLGELYGQKQN